MRAVKTHSVSESMWILVVCSQRIRHVTWKLYIGDAKNAPNYETVPFRDSIHKIHKNININSPFALLQYDNKCPRH